MSYPSGYGQSGGSSQAYANQAKQYKRQQIETATPEELLIMLYEGAIRFLVVAKKAYEKPEGPDIQAFHNNLLRSQDIIVEFMTSLDMELGGEMAANLFQLYEYLHYRLVQANIHKDMAMIDEVLDHLRKLKETWEQAIVIANREKAGLKINTASEERENPNASQTPTDESGTARFVRSYSA